MHEALRQRVAVHYHLEGLARDELDAYLEHQLQAAGAEVVESPGRAEQPAGGGGVDEEAVVGGRAEAFPHAGQADGEGGGWGVRTGRARLDGVGGL
jgi:hypothetical protein